MKGLRKAFADAMRGLVQGLFSGRNILLMLLAVVVASLTAVLLKFEPWQWIVVILCCMLVIALELFNTALEKLCDWIEPRHDKRVKLIKDLAAGAVLWASLGSAIIYAILVYNQLKS